LASPPPEPGAAERGRPELFLLRLHRIKSSSSASLPRTSQATVEMLQEHDFKVTYKETEGGHTWINWREYLKTFAQQLFR
jgi:enterochelin esterase family protein